MSALGLLSEGWLAPRPVQKPALCLLSLAWLCTLQQIQPQPPTPQPPIQVGGGGGGFAPFLFPADPTAPGPEILEPPSPQALDRRAETLAAAMGVSIADGDEATKLAATLALLLSKRRDS